MVALPPARSSPPVPALVRSRQKGRATQIRAFSALKAPLINKFGPLGKPLVTENVVLRPAKAGLPGRSTTFSVTNGLQSGPNLFMRGAFNAEKALIWVALPFCLDRTSAGTGGDDRAGGKATIPAGGSSHSRPGQSRCACGKGHPCPPANKTADVRENS